ncbi:uncharacterized protein LOC18431576 [Amborella trichopoda]|uniref:Late embryogenesis abundant protein LEA-2 subgroup domain-containing protein n=1 Tax=Amborella trichopoda TaxID=13333 RepID=W1P761_AMBTC|nr:uncharacterized protein LOC18431576 [Amborella trichopoda]ERN03436.1 hypothetical protein AMTR_s00003p00264210 [Amborella trichopoda]|eukprot:XP_006841761.1 uncharacterized protein LOC18431576 [Amborella trichopoda]
MELFNMKVLGFLAVVFMAIMGEIKGDAYGNQAPPPPFAVSGKTQPPQRLSCFKAKTTCFRRTIVCPDQCPQFKPADPTAKACYVNCNSPTCEAVCRNRRPNCEGTGAACYDPRFVGGDGVMFYFHGRTGGHFALVSDPSFQINARFIGLRPSHRTRDFTWIQALGFMLGSHSLTLSAKKASHWDPNADHLEFAYDGHKLELPATHLTSWSSPENDFSIERTAVTNSVSVTLTGKAEVSVRVVPVTPEDDKIHRYGIPEDDCFAHLEVRFKLLGSFSLEVEGVLGKTYRPGFKSPVKRRVAMPVMGGEDKYETSSLVAADCNVCVFSPENVSAESVEMAVQNGTTDLDCTGRLGNGNGIVCRR